LLQQLPPDDLTSTALEEDVIWDDDRGLAMLFKNREDVLEEVKLFVTRSGPEIVTVNDQ
jgi:hypothetical protein